MGILMNTQYVRCFFPHISRNNGIVARTSRISSFFRKSFAGWIHHSEKTWMLSKNVHIYVYILLLLYNSILCALQPSYVIFLHVFIIQHVIHQSIVKCNGMLCKHAYIGTHKKKPNRNGSIARCRMRTESMECGAASNHVKV